MSSDNDDDAPPCTAFAGPTPKIDDVDQDSCFKILLATDNHIGYAESDPVRGMDSINAFREILQLAVLHDVDMLLLAGDLFHENKPSRTSLFQTIAALREFTLGSRPITMEVVGDDGIGIARDATWAGINYEDENIRVGLPVFSIHGNHDDPQGTGAEGALCALDVLSASGLINYFGRLELPGDSHNDEDAADIGLHVKPVLLQKGSSKLALYGMGNIRDERFHYEMKNNRISLFRPEEGADDWFNILLVHQNRVPHGINNYVADTAFGDDAHLIVWGHEHDCIEKAGAVPVTGKNYYISQPGSSIATSLAKGESIPKHVALLSIQDGAFQMDPIRLRSVRPFVWDEIALCDVVPEPNLNRKTAADESKKAVNRCLKAKVEEMILKANDEWIELHPDEPISEMMLPLIRLRVDTTGEYSADKPYEVGNPQRFGQDFIGRVANPNDVVQFHKKKVFARKTKTSIDMPDAHDMADLQDGGKAEISQHIDSYLKAQGLEVLDAKKIKDALDLFIDKGEKDAIKTLVKSQVKRFTKEFEAHSQLGPADSADVDMRKELAKAKESLAEKDAAKQASKAKGKSARRGHSASESEGESSDASKASLASEASTSKVKGNGKSKALSKKPAAAKKALFEAVSDSESQDDEAVASDNSSSSGIEFVEAKKKKIPIKAVKKTTATATKKKAPAKKSAATTMEISDDSETDYSSDEAPKKKVVSRKK